jgi:hypothetical protein
MMVADGIGGMRKIGDRRFDQGDCNKATATLTSIVIGHA